MQEKVDMAQSIISVFPILKDPVTDGYVSTLFVKTVQSLYIDMFFLEKLQVIIELCKCF